MPLLAVRNPRRKQFADVVDFVIEVGGYCCPGAPGDDDDWDKLVAAESIGVLIRVRDVPGFHPCILNPDYTFVTNDERGHRMAREETIDTLILG